ncbi:MAG: glycerol-3-phosphate acyltransferase PlsY [Verrucomicrobiales bacterium]|jgi:glycerol-3-phosphate acyltransferase PlsY
MKLHIHAGIRAVAAVTAGYLLGNVPSADLAARFSGGPDSDNQDLRCVGSANPGALNVGQTLGKKWGAAVFAADVLKGTGAAAIGRACAGPAGANFAATAAVAGHCFPMGTRTGGKGVSTSIGQVLGTFPYYLPLDIAVGAATAALPLWTQRTWAATGTASAVWISSAALAYRRGWPTGIDRRAPLSLPLAAALSSAIIARRFRDTPLVDGKPTNPQGVGNDEGLDAP